ncbi:hypothetical protein [Tenacibaculum amylolyticum]|uniref:hypothetical protein n=1 Tax=Tenacibaculum amylolyticum TaxID=104269 RepID=UPI003894559B
MNLDFFITAKKPLSTEVRGKGITNWKDLVLYIQKLPYGRNKSRNDLSLVLKEGKGSCSSKHAFLKAIADEHEIESVKLVLAMYRMNATNTNIGDTLKDSAVRYIPEAHCYLKIDGERIDITSIGASFDKIEKTLLSEELIRPDQVATFKVNYHQEYLKDWIEKEEINASFNEIWELRERCIQYLSENNT